MDVAASTRSISSSSRTAPSTPDSGCATPCAPPRTRPSPRWRRCGPSSLIGRIPRGASASRTRRPWARPTSARTASNSRSAAPRSTTTAAAARSSAGAAACAGISPGARTSCSSSSPSPRCIRAHFLGPRSSPPTPSSGPAGASGSTVRSARWEARAGSSPISGAPTWRAAGCGVTSRSFARTRAPGWSPSPPMWRSVP